MDWCRANEQQYTVIQNFYLSFYKIPRAQIIVFVYLTTKMYISLHKLQFQSTLVIILVIRFPNIEIENFQLNTN